MSKVNPLNDVPMMAWRAVGADNDVKIASLQVALLSLRRLRLGQSAGAYPVGSVYFGLVPYLYSTFSRLPSTGGVTKIRSVGFNPATLKVAGAPCSAASAIAKEWILKL